MKKTLNLLVILMLVLLFSCKKNLDVQSNQLVLEETSKNAFADGGGAIKFVPNQLLVKFKSGINEKERSRIITAIDGDLVQHVVTKTMKRNGDNDGIYVINTKTDVKFAANRMKGESQILYAEPNYIYEKGLASNDPYFTNGNLWGMMGSNSKPANKYGSGAALAWKAGHVGSSSVYVGIIDEGVMYDHEDLAGQFWVNPYEIPNDSIDNDGNGYVDDIRGWDFYTNDNSTFDSVSDDHGTHVAGTLGAKGGNGIGVAGVNWNLKIITAKFLGFGGGTTLNAVLALDYLIDLKTRHGLNIVATNNSWYGGAYSQALYEAIDRAGAANILFVTIAGNLAQNNDVTASYPGSYTNPNVITVANITSAGLLSSTSSYGATSVDIGAPGTAIYSTVPVLSNGVILSGYGSYNGTSMAAPHVTGAALIYASTHPGATALQIKTAILNSAIATPSLTGKCVTGGRLNMANF